MIIDEGWGMPQINTKIGSGRGFSEGKAVEQ